MAEKFIFDCSDEFLTKVLKVRIPGGQWMEDPTETVTRTYLDTFDWRFFRNATVMEARSGQHGHRLTWRALGSGNILEDRSTSTIPKDAQGCLSPALRERLEPVLGRRALLKQVTVTSDTRSLRLLDDEEKTTLRIEVREDVIMPPGSTECIRLPRRVYLFPFRGFEPQIKQVRKQLKPKVGLTPVGVDPLLEALQRIGIRPAQYTNKPDFDFAPEQPTHEAVRLILSSLVGVMRANIDGILQDLDSEFLHDFLLAVRRTRCLFSQFSGFFAERKLALIQQEFAWLEKAAASTRDMDIYLGLVDGYTHLLPQNLRQALIPLAHFMEKQRDMEFKKTKTSLDSPRFHNLMDNWQRLLDGALSLGQTQDNATPAIVKVASQRIERQFHRVIEHGDALGQDSPVSDLLELYQQSKTLGYLLELFRGLYPEKKFCSVDQELRALQKRLNSFHDLDQQQRALHEAGIMMKQNQRVMPIWLEAVEVLVADLAGKREQVLMALPKRFARFSRKKVRKEFAALFS